MLRKSQPAEAALGLSWPTLAHGLRDRSQRHPDRPALSFLTEESFLGSSRNGSAASLKVHPTATLTYGQLDARVTELAARLSVVAEPGDRAVLLFPPGLEFLIGFCAAQYAGMVPVPTSFPKPGRAMPRLDSAARDCQARVLLADSATLEGIDSNRVSESVNALIPVATDHLSHTVRVSGEGTERNWEFDSRLVGGDQLALLQYTSGSTSEPKGVMVSHQNLISNLESIRQAFCIESVPDDSDDYSRGVFWLPPFHDMGLIGGILEAIYVGGHTTLMGPRTFLQRPVRWLEAIAACHASISGAPNFAYQLCVDRIDPQCLDHLDLSGWELAFCGAEPISAETLQRFASRFARSGFRVSSFCPCYGLAESTLLAAGGVGSAEPRVISLDRDELARGRVATADPNGASPESLPPIDLVACGEPGWQTDVCVVDPESHQLCGHDQIGEIWLHGTSVTSGYWQRDQINADQFGARIANASHEKGYCRTGDLGFFRDGQLFVTGRRKDVIILRGRNHYPQDIEASIRAVGQNLVVQCVAVSIPGVQADVLAVVVEVSRHLDEEALPELVRKFRRQIIEDHEVDARRVLLVRPATIPLTTSGKVQRQACLRMLLEESITARHDWKQSQLGDTSGAVDLPPLPKRVAPDSVDQATSQIQTWLIAWLRSRDTVDSVQVSPETGFDEYGLDSLAAVELSGELEDWLGLELTPVLAWNYPTPAKLAQYLAEEMAGVAHSVDSDESMVEVDEDEDFEALLAEIESSED
ncbi:MAG: AMP-binding protein [Planctomycetota bacterium]